MEFALIAVAAVIGLVIVSVFARRLGVAAPVLLVVIGLGISLLPGTPTLHLPSDIVLDLVLPPLLYAAAIRVPLVDLRRNLTTIAGLSVFLVLGSAFAVAGIVYALLPGVGFGPALALGAVVSPTDAVAASAIAKRLGLPARLVALLEGESLVNDASALTMLRVAIGATGAGITAGGVIGTLLYSIAVAVICGLVIGAVTVRFRSRLKDPVLDSVVSFAVPFVAFFPVEALHASGVIAVVTVGIYTGHVGARLISAPARIAERVNWSTVQFLLENGVFLVMGLQLTALMGDVSSSRYSVTIAEAIGFGLLVALALLLVRALFVWPLLWLQGRRQNDVDAMGERIEQLAEWVRRMAQPDSERGRRQMGVAERRIAQHSGDVNDLRRDRLDGRSGVVATWAGMRGVVTLAAAQSIPDTAPYRAELILIAFVVALATLVVQGGTLPWVIRLSKVGGTDAEADARELASLMDELQEAGMSALESPTLELPRGVGLDENAVAWLRDDLEATRERAWERVDAVTSDAVGPHEQYRMLLRQVLDAQRLALLDARRRGVYASRVIDRAQRELDAEETRLQVGGA